MQKGTAEMADDLGFCPIRRILDGLGDKWTILVMFSLVTRSHRFSELRRAIPDVSQRMLTQTLRKLERDGLVNRAVTPVIPPRVDYVLTGLGRSLAENLAPLARWAEENLQTIYQARSRFEAR